MSVNTVFDIALTPLSECLVIVDIAADFATYAAGNGNTEAPTFSITFALSVEGEGEGDPKVRSPSSRTMPTKTASTTGIG